MAIVQLRARRATPMPDAVRDLAGLASWLGERVLESETWVATEGDSVVGYVRFTDEWVDDLYVDPASSGAGIGSALLDVAKSRLTEGFSLWVFEQNAPARAFYARRGLLELETTDGSANEERSPDIRVVWPGSDPHGHLAALLADVNTQTVELESRRTALERALDALGPGVSAVPVTMVDEDDVG